MGSFPGKGGFAHSLNCAEPFLVAAAHTSGLDNLISRQTGLLQC